MSQLVKIAVYPFELHSALDQIHKWSRNQCWDTPPYSNPSFDIELEVMLDERGIAKKYNGDRFDLEDPFWYRSDEEKQQLQQELENGQRILDMLRKPLDSREDNDKAEPLLDRLRRHNIVKEETSDTFSLMDHLKEKARG